MKDNQFDYLVKKRLEAHESGVPLNMWERITGNEEERKGGFIPARNSLIALILLLLIGFGSIYFLLHKDDITGKSIVADASKIPEEIKKDKSRLNSNKNISANILSRLKHHTPGNVNTTFAKNKRLENRSPLRHKKK